ncbi:hypothetical protein AOR13_1345 [Alteromonas stellipolaris LMG 21856]|nr:hypothetical protein AOR13_1345 [Alteromonas stellipolaris LMG 21856]
MSLQTVDKWANGEYTFAKTWIINRLIKFIVSILAVIK